MSISLDEIDKLKKMLEQQEEEMLINEFQGKKILGFSLSKGSTKSANGKKYVVWRAHACKDRKKIIIHIGKDPRLAESKIKAYLKEHPETKL